MIEEQSWMSWQLGKEREGGMETEKLSSHLAQNRPHNKSLMEQYTVLLGLDSPNHVVSSLLLAPKRRRAIGESHLYLNMCILINMSKVFFNWFYKETASSSILPQFIVTNLTSWIHSLSLSCFCSFTHLLYIWHLPSNIKTVCITPHSQKKPQTIHTLLPISFHPVPSI